MKINKEEKIVRDKLIGLGFIVSLEKPNFSNGVDLIAIKDGKAFLIEVKKAYFNSRAWKIPKVQKSGVASDIIAIVFGNEVIFNSMEDHLKLCDKGGFRSMTKILNFIMLSNSKNHDQ